MPTPKMKARVPSARSYRKDMEQSIMEQGNQGLAMGEVEASTATPTFKPEQAAGKPLRLAEPNHGVERY